MQVMEQTTTSSPVLPEIEFSVDGVPVEHLPIVWDDAWLFLEPAVRRFQVRHVLTEEIVLRRLFQKTMQLWVAFDRIEGRICGAVITEILTDERVKDGPVCSIPLVGGIKFNGWGDTIWTTIKAWAAAQGCVACVGYGRKGWQRLYGFIECGKTDDGVSVMIRRLKKG